MAYQTILFDQDAGVATITNKVFISEVEGPATLGVDLCVRPGCCRSSLRQDLVSFTIVKNLK